MVQTAASQPRPAQERIGRYEVLRRIATGGMAELFLAKHVGMEGFEKVVAIKRILAHLAHDDEFVNMFRDEARLVAKLSHPNIVQIYDLGKSADSYFIAMEYIPGRNLASIAKKARAKVEVFPPLYIARAMAQACEALHYAHTRTDTDGRPMGIVHRDVSPQNIILSFSGAVKLVDFGIAKAATKIAHTRAGVLKGKYAYMSPEQIKGEEIDARSDLFSVGIVLFELLCGKRPFEKENSIQTLKAIVQDPHVDPRTINADIPDGLAEIIHRALTKDRNQRYQSAQEVQLALEDFVSSTGERINAVVVGEWVTRLFDDEIDRGKGGVVQLKGGAEVILPESEKIERSDREEPSDDIPDPEDSEAVDQEVGPAAPLGGAVRGGGSVMGRGASAAGERMRLLEEGVIAGRERREAGDEEATAIATGEAEPDLAEAARAVGVAADGPIADQRPLYQEEERAARSAAGSYDDSRTELADDALAQRLRPSSPDVTVEAARIAPRITPPAPAMTPPRVSVSKTPAKASLTPAKSSVTPAKSSVTPAKVRSAPSGIATASARPVPAAPSAASPALPGDFDLEPLDLNLDTGDPATLFGSEATLLPGEFGDGDPWGDKTSAEPGSEDYTPDGGVVVRDSGWADPTAADTGASPALSRRPAALAISEGDAIAGSVDPWDDKTSASAGDPAEANESSRVAVFDAEAGWGDKTVGFNEDPAGDELGFGGDLAIDATAGMSVEELAAKLNSARGEKTSAMPALFDHDGFGANSSADRQDWSPSVQGGGSTDEWAAGGAPSFDESALPASVDRTRNVELDSSTVAATMADYAEEGIELGVGSAFAYDEPTRGNTGELEAEPPRPRNALGAIRLAKVAAAPVGGVEEISSVPIEEPTSELGTEQFAQRPIAAAPPPKVMTAPKALSAARVSAASAPSAPAAPAPMFGRGESRPPSLLPRGASEVPSVSGEGTYNEPVLPPGGPVLGDFDLDALLAPMVPPLAPADPLAGMGSTRVPPANVSLSEMLLDRSQQLPPPPRAAAPRSASAASAAPGLKSAAMIRGASVAGSAPSRPPTAVRVVREGRRAPPSGLPSLPPGSGVAMPGMGDTSSVTGPVGMMPGGPPPPMFSGVSPSPVAVPLALAPPPRPRARMSTAQLVTIVVSCVVIAVVLGAIGYVKLRPPSLEIRTAPDGARVFLGGQPLAGTTPLSVPIEPDREYAIRIVRAGYEDYERTVRIPRDRKALMVTFTLTPAAGAAQAPPPAPP